MDWFGITLLCAFSLASADAFTKRWLSDYRARDLALVRFAVPGVLLLPLVLLQPLPPAPTVFWWWIAALVPLELLAMVLYVWAIRDAPLHLTLPYLAFTPVFNVLTAWLVLGETVTGMGLAGILLVVAGAYLLNLEPRRQKAGGGWLTPLSAIARERGSRLMLLVSVIYSLTSVLGKGAMGYATPETFGPFYYALLGASAVLLSGLHEPSSLRVLFRRPTDHLAIGLMMAVMVVTHFLAIARVEVAYMIAVKRTSMLFGILYGVILFHQWHGFPRHLVAAGMMVFGVAIILT